VILHVDPPFPPMAFPTQILNGGLPDPKTLAYKMSWNPFRVPSRSGAEWFSVGPASAFPDLDDDGAVSQSKIPICGAADDDNVSGNGNAKPGCKVFYVPREDSRQRVEISITSDQDQSPEVDLTDQVLVFRFRGKIHAVDHVS